MEWLRHPKKKNVIVRFHIDGMEYKSEEVAPKEWSNLEDVEEHPLR